MNLLIVDDEVFTVRAIQTTLDWAKLGIEKTFSAYNAARAKEIIISENIDLILCDIEMPKEDGLSLVAWLRQLEVHSDKNSKKQTTEVVFLTCHSEFEYARKALQMNVFDYVVKPVDFEELEKTICKAIEKIRAEQQKKLKTQMGEYWLENKKIAEEQFWRNMFKNSGTISPEAAEESARRQNIVFDKDKIYRLILFKIRKISTSLEKWDNELIMFAMQNMAKELILNDLDSSRVVVRDNDFIIISESSEQSEIQVLCESYISSCKKYMGVAVICYISNSVFCEELPDAVASLVRLAKNDVAGANNIVFDCGVHIMEEAELTIPADLKERLDRGDFNEFYTLYRKFMEEAVRSQCLNYAVLKNIQHDLLQCFFVYMERHHLQAHQVFRQISSIDAGSRDADTPELFGVDVVTVEQLDDWVQKCVTMLEKEKDINHVPANEAIIEKIRKYVLEHLDGEIGRDEIAAYVNLSPDYMSKIFKNITRKTLSQYIVDERMEKAVLLMRTTNLNISQIAMQVGCDNFSYFTKLFKKYTGKTPREYRL